MNPSTESPPPALDLPRVALSIRQPWAWLILHAGKDIENRSWPTKFRGRVLLHAGKRWTWEEKSDREEAMEDYEVEIPEKLDLGGIVGVAELVDCVTDHHSGWFCGPYGFVLRNVQPLPFRPCKGMLGFFPVPA